jgi:hypothetical protein
LRPIGRCLLHEMGLNQAVARRDPAVLRHAS